MSIYLGILSDFYSSYKIRHHKNWQSKEVNMPFYELLNYMDTHEMPLDEDGAIKEYSPVLPWAMQHLKERLSGKPLNPPPSHIYWQRETQQFLSKKEPEKFSHSYPERYNYNKLVSQGARYKNGCIDDIIIILSNDPDSRQAYYPLFCFEDLNAAIEKERVPCTLGYYFYIEDGALNISYIIRSCDIIRHLNNDLFLTWGLAKYILDNLKKYEHLRDLQLGNFNFICFNLHCFANDDYTLKRLLKII